MSALRPDVPGSSSPERQRDIRPPQAWLWMAAAIAVPAAILYLLFPTRQYYWDGILFAIDVESAARIGIGSLVEPNHLLFNAVAFLFYWPLHALSATVRSLPVLQGMDITSSLLTTIVLCRLLHKLFSDRYLTLVLSAIFAFGATWWKFSVDSDAYILATLFLVLAASELLLNGNKRLVLTGIWHCAAMALHQLSVFFLPAVWVSILLDSAVSLRRRLLKCVAYSVVTGCLMVALYYIGFRLPNTLQSPTTFFAWLSSHSDDSSFAFNIPYIAAGTLKSYAQLLFGGRVRLFREFLNPATLLLSVVLAALIAWFFYVLWRYRKDFPIAAQSSQGALWSNRSFLICGTWFISYGLFLLFWLPRNTFYKLFSWPAAILLVACIWNQLKPRAIPHRGRLAILLGIELIWNFIFFIYPYSRTEANPVLSFAEHISSVWLPDSVIYFRVFETNDWTVRYAAPQTVWKSLVGSGEAGLKMIEADRINRDVWLDPTASRYLASSSATKVWWDRQVASGAVTVCCGREWPLGFTRLSGKHTKAGTLAEALPAAALSRPELLGPGSRQSSVSARR
jgi:hypothetical protein